MRKFNITVNGTAYEVEVEEVAAGETAAPKAAAAPAAPKAAPAAKPAASKAAPVANVKQGDILVILEAMKMENEILAPQDGTVAQVNVSKGASVNSGDVLVVLS